MKHEDDYLDEQIRQFPRHEMDEQSREAIHDTLMKTRMGRSERKKRGPRKTGFAIGLASVAALVLVTVLGLSFFQGNGMNTADENSAPAENASRADDFEPEDKAVPDRGNETEDPGDEAPADGTDPEEGETDNKQEENASQEADDSSESNDAEGDGNGSSSTDDGTEEGQQQDIREISDTIIDALDNRDMQTVAQYVHPEKGLLFSPYVYITDDAPVFDKDEVTTMLESEEAHVWGKYDGKGTPIDLTPAEYFDEFLEMEPYQEPDEVLIDEQTKRGNTKNNIKEVFPDATVIEYYDDGTEEYTGIDWNSVNLVYEKNETGEPKLVAIVRDMWTV